jgi:FkbH-like protein
LGLEQEIRFAGYNQLFQQLLDPVGLFARNRGGYNVILVRFEDWLRDKSPVSPAERAGQLAEAVRTAASSFPAPLIVTVCPSTPEHESWFPEVERVLRDGIGDTPNVYAIWPSDLLALYPVEEIHDPHGDELGHLPYTPVFFTALATAVARRIHAIAHIPYKVIALDCDDTLWSGICGEDGPEGVVLDGSRRSLQEFMAEKRRGGMLLALCSKNNEEDVRETFRCHPEMPLRLDDFAGRAVNWTPKVQNLRSLAGELELGLDSFILVDDNPKECTEVQAGAPEVLVLPLPKRPEEIPGFLMHVWAFDRALITEEDRLRPELYAQRAERTRAERAASNLEEFLASLQLEVRIEPMQPGQLARAAQLTQRTNQMNATCVRRTEAELQDVMRQGAECLTVEVRDRFGSYGLTGLMILRATGDAMRAETFLLSCRVLGRGVEHRMVAHLGDLAVAQGLKRVEIPFVPCQRNRPAFLFLETLRQPGADGVFEFAAQEAADVRFRAGQVAASPAQAEPPGHNNHAPHSARRVDYVEIARELRDPAAILERIRAASRRTLPERAVSAPPRTPLERELVELWAGLLNVRPVGVYDNFFELGGHSLLAVQLLSRVRQVYGVDLSLEVVYSGEFTVAELAKAVELKEMEQSGADYQDILQELEGLSDEEVRALLAEEQDAGV